MTPSPIAKVLSTVWKNRVRALLMGGQACILYGAAEFSRDVDIAVLPDPKNLRRLHKALEELHGELILFPPLNAETLQRGLACHFRCHDRDAEGSTMRQARRKQDDIDWPQRSSNGG